MVATADRGTAWGRRRSPSTLSAAWRIPAMEADEERGIARRILELERRIRAALKGQAACAKALRSGKRLVNRGRAGTQDCLADAVHAIAAAAGKDPALRALAREARAGWAEITALRWELAVSGARVAAHEARRRASPWASAEDLLQEGFLGLMQAAIRFDPDREIRFSTYARWWVRAQLSRAMDHGGRAVRLPSGAVDQLRLLTSTIEGYEQEGADWTMSEVAATVGVDVERARLLLQVQGGSVSLDDLELRFALHLATADGPRPDLAIAERQQAELLHDAVERVLTDKQRFVLTRRFGLDGDDEQTLAEVGKRLRVTKERVRQIERKALLRLMQKGGLRAHQPAAR
jgi:RNA polymerase sigma factor (sigma-70 family)